MDIKVDGATPSRYDASSITVMKGLRAVRERPAMYIGSTGAQGLHHLLDEVVQNAVDEILAGHCRDIAVTIHKDGSFSVKDDGRGIPVDIHPDAGRPACEVVFTTLHAGGKFDRNTYLISGGLHGVGLACVNALSEWTVLDSWRDGHHYRQRFSRGDVVSDVEDVGASTGTGTRVHFRPDTQIFGDAIVERDLLTRRLQEVAFLHPGTVVRVEDQRDGYAEVYEQNTGIVGLVKHLTRKHTLLHPEPIHMTSTHEGVMVDIAMLWTTAYAEDLSTYANGIPTSRGGVHLEGLKAALTRVFSRYAAEHDLIDAASGETIAGYDVREGLTCVLTVKMQSPEFEGQTKSVLTTPRAGEAVERIVSEQLSAFFDANPSVAKVVVGKAIEASRFRAAARRAGERARYQSHGLEISKEVYKTQFGIRSRNWHESARWITDNGLLQTHAARCEVNKDARVLDVCCGSGVVGASFRGKVGKIIGLDLTPEMIKLAQTRLDEVHQGDVYSIPFEANSFDMVVNREVLHLLPRPERPVSEILRVLKPGGQFVVGQLVPFSDVDAPWMFRLLKKKQPLFFNNFTEQDFHALLAGAGFVNITSVEYLQWEDIDVWIDTHETPSLHRHEIRDLYHNAPAEVRAVHPFEILPSGAIRDCWRWCVFTAFKPAP